jgi:hypothetical protein
MRDEVREEVGENPKQRQTTDTIGGENPGAAAFMLLGGSRGLRSRRNDTGPIFHAKEPPDGKIVAQARYASRLLRGSAQQDYLAAILPRIGSFA